MQYDHYNNSQVPATGNRESYFGQGGGVADKRDTSLGQKGSVTDPGMSQRDSVLYHRDINSGQSDFVTNQRDSNIGQGNVINTNFSHRDSVLYHRDTNFGQRDSSLGQRDSVLDNRDLRIDTHHGTTHANSHNEVYGTDRSDILRSTSTIDHLLGGHGNDYLVAGIGNSSNDILDGGNGHDTAIYVINSFNDIKNFRCYGQNNQTEKVEVHNPGGHNQPASIDTLYGVESIAFTTDGHEFQQYDLESVLTMIY